MKQALLQEKHEDERCTLNRVGLYIARRSMQTVADGAGLAGDGH